MIYVIVLYYHHWPRHRALVQPLDPTDKQKAEELVKTLNTRTLLATGYTYKLEEL